jgi:hypothetical protein
LEWCAVEQIQKLHTLLITLQFNFKASQPITIQLISNHIGSPSSIINGAALSVTIVTLIPASRKSIAVLCHWYSGRVSQLYTTKSIQFFLLANMVLIAELLWQYVNTASQ